MQHIPGPMQQDQQAAPFGLQTGQNNLGLNDSVVRQLIEQQAQNLLDQMLKDTGEGMVTLAQLSQTNSGLAKQFWSKAEKEVNALLNSQNQHQLMAVLQQHISGLPGPQQPMGQQPGNQLPPGPPPLPPPQPISIPLAEVRLPPGVAVVGGNKLLTGCTGGPLTVMDHNGQELGPNQLPPRRPGPFEQLNGLQTSGEVNLKAAHDLVQSLTTKANTRQIPEAGLQAAAMAVAGELEQMLGELNNLQQQQHATSSGPGPQLFHNPPLGLGIEGGNGISLMISHTPGSDMNQGGNFEGSEIESLRNIKSDAKDASDSEELDVLSSGALEFTPDDDSSHAPPRCSPVLEGPAAEEEARARALELAAAVQKRPFTNEGLRKKHIDVVAALYDKLGFQCKQDGFRFHTKSALDKHMDLLFQRNKDKKGKAQGSRMWYLNLDDWKAEFVGKQKESDNASGQDAMEGDVMSLPDKEADSKETSIPADDDCKNCRICGQEFEADWDDDESEWVYRKVKSIKVEDPKGNQAEEGSLTKLIVHQLCLEALGQGSLEKITVDELESLYGGAQSPTGPTSPVLSRRSSTELFNHVWSSEKEASESQIKKESPINIKTEEDDEIESQN